MNVSLWLRSLVMNRLKDFEIIESLQGLRLKGEMSFEKWDNLVMSYCEMC